MMEKALVVSLLLSTACAVPPGSDEARVSGIDARVFTGARLIVGDGAVIEDASFVVERDLITEVGESRVVDVPARARVVDLTGQTVMPALVNTHAHLGWEKYSSWGSENFTRENLIDHLDRHAYYGVGTIISTGSDKEEVALRVRHDQRVGTVGGARYLVSPGIGTPGGGPNPRFTDDEGWWGIHHVTSPAEAREIVRSARAFGLDQVGTLKAGMTADFVVLDANPLDDIANTRRISQVYLRGERIDRNASRVGWTR